MKRKCSFNYEPQLFVFVYISRRNVCRYSRIESYVARERYYSKCGWLNWWRCTRHRLVKDHLDQGLILHFHFHLKT